MVYSIIVPISMYTLSIIHAIPDLHCLLTCIHVVPFVIDALQNGKSPDSGPDPYHSEVSDGGSVSQDTGVLLALFAAGLLVGSPILGYLGKCHIVLQQGEKSVANCLLWVFFFCWYK